MTQNTDPIPEMTPDETFEALEADANAVLVDVRTRAEWSYVGIVDLGALGRDPVLIEWQTFPTMEVAYDFGPALEGACPDKSAALYFLCRSGARSLAAAKLASALGYRRCVNVKDGFEGPPDAEGHRGTVAGWKASGLPWRQS